MKIKNTCWLILLLLGLPAVADQVLLKNGHQLEGVIAEETPAAIVLTVSGGAITLKRSSVSAVIHAPSDQDTALEETWRERRYLDRGNVPVGYEPLAEQFRTLDVLRARAGSGDNLIAVSEYLAGIQTCSQALAGVDSAWPADSQPEAAPFLRRVREQLRLAQADFLQAAIQPERRGNAFLVPVLLNGRTEARFIIDTGAEITTLSRDAATRAGLTRTNRIAQVGMADGTRMEAPVMQIDSLRLGALDRKNTEAVVLAQPPDAGVDGLLGMNVLHAFLIQFDPRTGRLDLEKFAPR